MGYAKPSENGQIATECYHPSTRLRHGRLGSIVLGTEFDPLRGVFQYVESVVPSAAIKPSEREQVVTDRCAGCQVHTRGWRFSGQFLLLPHLCVRVIHLYYTGQGSLCVLREVSCASAMNECFAACLPCRVQHPRHRLVPTAGQGENASHDYEGVRKNNTTINTTM